MQAPCPIIAIAGPTGSGKSSTAIQVARKLIRTGRNAEILCADSITHYRGFDIGSAKPSKAEQAEIRHHLLDICAPADDFTAGDFVRSAEAIITKLFSEHTIPLVVGGSGFYLKALFKGMAVENAEDLLAKQKIRARLEARLKAEGANQLYEEMLKRDPNLQGRIHPNDAYRVVRAMEAMELTGASWSSLNQEAEERPLKYPQAKIFCLAMERARLLERIQLRSEQMLRAGLIAEVKSLLHQGISPEAKPFSSIGYRQVLEFLGLLPPPAGKSAPASEEELAAAISLETMRLAKSQSTWFRGQAPKPVWIDAEKNPEREILAQALGLP